MRAAQQRQRVSRLVVRHALGLQLLCNKRIDGVTFRRRGNRRPHWRLKAPEFAVGVGHHGIGRRRNLDGIRRATGDPGTNLLGFRVRGQFDGQLFGALIRRHRAGHDPLQHQTLVGLAGHQRRPTLAALQARGVRAQIKPTLLLISAMARHAASLQNATDLMLRRNHRGYGRFEALVDPIANHVHFGGRQLHFAGRHLARHHLVHQQALRRFTGQNGQTRRAALQRGLRRTQIELTHRRGTVAGIASCRKDGLDARVKVGGGQSGGEDEYRVKSHHAG